ncbi:ankyrin repeat-containing domain protein [Aspergillus parasiticus]|uniref:Ankyrin repeat-containing domain protein n=1 Tax=Aspergillus parasiticus TaxID=5067 RepID=A0A5N6D9M4_ASPPA|nr:ankyrin repeat-containing domain protein [Aspergillus parasiticus]
MKKANERTREMEFQERPVVLQLLIDRLRERGSPVSEWKRYHDGVDPCYPALAVTLRKVLYNNGSDVIARLNKESLPTLCHAVIFDYWEVVEFLMNNGVDPNQTDGTLSILQYMAKCGSERSAQLLIVAGADVHAVDKNGYSVIYCAVTVISGNGPAIIDVLLTNGVNANAKFGPKMATALHYAAEHGNTAILQLLLSRGASRDAIDSSGEMALDWAKRKHREAAIDLLNCA